MMKTNPHYRGSYNWQRDTSKQWKLLPSKCAQVKRAKVKAKPTVAAALFLVALSISVSTWYLGAVQDTLEEKLSIGTKSVVRWPIRDDGNIDAIPPSDQSSLPDGCDWSCYVENYDDLYSMKDSPELAVSHWFNHGEAEGRDCTCKRLPSDCNWQCYLDNYQDLNHLVRTKLSAIQHFLTHGIAEERDCTCQPTFRAKTTNDTAAICVIASEEEIYIDEWLDFHLSIGFHHICVYDNSDGNDLGHGWLSRRPRLANKVTIHHFPGKGMQMPAYRHCLKNHMRPKGYGWVAFMDVDEFLVLKKHTHVVDFLLEYAKQGSISLNWELYGWDGRLQFSPKPVTKRFQGNSNVGENAHVKTISNVDAILPGQPTNPHYVLLIDGQQQLDTDGDIVADKWKNDRRPTDVAVINHYHTKSHKEYIDKRSRGRSDLSGNLLSSTVLQNVAAAKTENLMLHTETTDGIAWSALVSKNNKYKIFDSPELYSQQPSSHQSTIPIVICAIVTSQEAYIDEWVDYHLALGISLQLIDSSDAFWMRQWSDERRMNSLAEVVHFPGNASSPEFIAKAYARCMEDNVKMHKKVLLMEVNDFLMPDRSLERELHTNNQTHDHQNCVANITKIKRVLFGNGKQVVYDPLPVTKRFQHRVRIRKNSTMTKPILFTSSVMTEHDILKYITTGDLESDQCAVGSNDLVAYHYTRSHKECKQQRGDVDLCKLTGDIEDTSGWGQVQKVLPIYSEYNGFI